jgi:hypothetical protein
VSHPRDLRACPRCGIRRYVKNTRPHELCRDCRAVDPEYGKPPPPRDRKSARFGPIEGQKVVTALVQIAQRVELAVGKQRTCCGICGCLIFTWERCPRCALAAVRRAEGEAA